MNTYEPPQLTLVGEASEIILGICSIGWDLDGSLLISSDEYAALDEVDAD